jgi:hypothetical protein
MCEAGVERLQVEVRSPGSGAEVSVRRDADKGVQSVSERGSKPMGSFWSYFLEFFGLAGLMGRAKVSVPAPALTTDSRGERKR